jgi:hypothetical protein
VCIVKYRPDVQAPPFNGSCWLWTLKYLITQHSWTSVAQNEGPVPHAAEQRPLFWNTVC